MQKRFTIMLLLALSVLYLHSLNHMELLFQITGEFDGATMGHTVVSLDYNGDGYDDLIASAMGWNPTGVFNSQAPWGKLYYYMGARDLIMLQITNSQLNGLIISEVI